MTAAETSKLRSYALAKRDKFNPTLRTQRTLEIQLLLHAKVLSLRAESLSYSRIILEIQQQYGVRLSKSVVSEWVNRKHSPNGRARNFQPVFCPELGYIIGVEAGDGSLSFNRYNYRIRLKAKDKDFVDEFNRCLSSVLQTGLHRAWKTPGKDEFHLDVSSYLLYRFLRRPLSELMPWIEYNQECVAAFLRGFFDSEGSISADGQLTASNTNLELLNYVQTLLTRLGMVSTGPRLGTRRGSVLRKNEREFIRKSDCYVIYIKRAYLSTFRSKIGFTIARKRDRLEQFLNAAASEDRRNER